MRKRILSLLLVLIFVVGVVGCGSNKPADSNSSSMGKKVKISLWHSFVGADQRAPFMEERMKQFREEYPDIEIDEQKIPRDQYQTKLKTQAAAFYYWNANTASVGAGAAFYTDEES